MKPKTKLQKRVIALSNELPKIDEKILLWAKVHCLEHKGYSTKSKVICMDCGNTFSTDLVIRKQAICPHCNTKISIEQTRKRKDKQGVDVAFAQIHGEFQVIRNFELFAYYKEGYTPHYYIWEVLQHWILPNGDREVVARTHNMGSTAWCGDLEIRQKTTGSYYYQRLNEVYPYKFHPHSRFKSEYRFYGINSKLQGLTFLEAIRIVPENPKAETLLKAKQYGLLSYCSRYDGKINTYWPSIKICLRNKYLVKDASIWFDYLDLLKYFKKDLNNAHYVCPKNLKKEHDVYMKRKRKIIDHENMKSDYIRILKRYGEYNKITFEFPKNLKREYQALVEREKRDKLEKEKKKLEEMDLKYQKFIQPFLDVLISDKTIKIAPLSNIDEFRKEGDILHHCVYTSEYFKRENCLILSARIDGNSIETIEIDLKRMKIVQCRGLGNDPTKHHDRIISLVNKNMHLIKERLKPKKNGTKKDVNTAA